VINLITRTEEKYRKRRRLKFLKLCILDDYAAASAFASAYDDDNENKNKNKNKIHVISK